MWDSTYEWNDADWMAARAAKQAVDEPMSVYEVHLASWRKHYSGELYDWHQMADALVPYLDDLGFWAFGHFDGDTLHEGGSQVSGEVVDVGDRSAQLRLPGVPVRVHHAGYTMHRGANR